MGRALDPTGGAPAAIPDDNAVERLYGAVGDPRRPAVQEPGYESRRLPHMLTLGRRAFGAWVDHPWSDSKLPLAERRVYPEGRYPPRLFPEPRTERDAAPPWDEDIVL